MNRENRIEEDKSHEEVVHRRIRVTSKAKFRNWRFVTPNWTVSLVHAPHYHEEKLHEIRHEDYFNRDERVVDQVDQQSVNHYHVFIRENINYRIGDKNHFRGWLRNVLVYIRENVLFLKLVEIRSEDYLNRHVNAHEEEDYHSDYY